MHLISLNLKVKKSEKNLFYIFIILVKGYKQVYKTVINCTNI